MTNNTSDNLDKLRVLVEELNVRDKNIIETKELLEVIIETATDGYWDWHITKDYEYLSPGFKAQLGYTDEEMPNHPSSWQKCINEGDLGIMLEEVNKHFETGGKYEFSVRSRYTKKCGEEIIVLCRGKVVEWGENGEPIRMVGTHIDITNLL